MLRGASPAGVFLLKTYSVALLDRFLLARQMLFEKAARLFRHVTSDADIALADRSRHHAGANVTADASEGFVRILA